ncbi:MAG: LLM class flavin-dependent oxidoreductase [Acidimicrobiales bacterium]
MKIGYAASTDAAATSIVAAARAAEKAGFDEIWLPEDYCERGVFAIAGAVAGATREIHIGIGVINPWTRHPVLTAMEAASLDELSDGRSILGIGASNERWMTGCLGIPFERPLSRTREAIGIIRDLLAGRRVQRWFGAYRLDAYLSSTPHRPDLPILLGAKGRRALSLASSHADGVLLSVLSAPRYITWAREQTGDPNLQITAYVLFACGPDAAMIRDRVRPTVAKYLGIHGEHDITLIAGLDPELCRLFRTRLLDGEPAAELVTDDILDTFAIVGDPSQCEEGLARFHAAGADGLVLVGDPASNPTETAAAAALARRAGLMCS